MRSGPRENHWQAASNRPINAAMKYLLNEKIFYPAAAAVALLLIAFSILWPQGLGLRSPAPFGHAVIMPDYFRMIHDQQARRIRQQAEKADRVKAQAALKEAEVSATASSSGAPSAAKTDTKTPALRP